MTGNSRSDFNIRTILTALFYLVSAVTLIQSVNYLGVLFYGLEFLTWWPLGEAMLFGLGGKPESSLIAHVSGLAIELAVPGLEAEFKVHWLTRSGLSLITTSLFLVVLGILRRMLITINVKKPFDSANIRRVQFISLLLLTDVFVLDYFRTESMLPIKQLVSQMPAPILHADSSYQNADVHAYILLLLLFTLAAIFRRGLDLYQTQRELEHRLYQKQKLEALGTLASGIGHDFNNILTSITGYAEIAKSETQEKDAHFALDRVLDACHRAKRLTQQVRALGPQASNAEQEEVLELKNEIDELLVSIAPSVPDHVAIVTQIPPNAEYKIKADSTQLYQVMLNLVTNAIQAMGEKPGQLTISLSHVSNQGKGMQGKSGVRLSFIDTGPGMSSEQMSHIFEPYFTTKKKQGGTGLGLALCHRIVQELGGEIEVESACTIGSQFHIWLPTINAKNNEDTNTETDAISAPNSHEAPERVNERILLVDDDEAVLSLLTRRLTELGYCIYAFANSEQVLTRLTEAPTEYDLVITDLNMPKVSGIEIAEARRQAGITIPVVVITAMPEQAEVAFDEGIIQGLVAKPIAMSELQQTITQVLRNAQQQGRKKAG